MNNTQPLTVDTESALLVSRYEEEVIYDELIDWERDVFRYKDMAFIVLYDPYQQRYDYHIAFLLKRDRNGFVELCWSNYLSGTANSESEGHEKAMKTIDKWNGLSRVWNAVISLKARLFGE